LLLIVTHYEIVLHQGTISLHAGRTQGKENRPKSIHPIAEQSHFLVGSIASYFFDQLRICSSHDQMTAKILIDWNEENLSWICHVNDSKSDCRKRCTHLFRDTICCTPEVVSHIFIHSLSQNSALYESSAQSGAPHERRAIEESVADICSYAFMNYICKEQSWQLGDQHFDLPIQAYNSLTNDSVEPSRAKLGISMLNHAFYLAASPLGNEHLAAVTRIWFQALWQLNSRDVAFLNFAKETLKIAKSSGHEQIEEALLKSWKQVGVIEDRDVS